MILLILLQFSILLPFVLGCGGKKKKSGKTTKEPAKSKMNAPPPSAQKSVAKEPEQKPAEEEPAAPPPKAPSPPKPVVEDTKVAEMMPESVKEDEMKGGIKLPAPPKNLKCESDVAPKKEAKPAEKEKKDDEIL